MTDENNNNELNIPVIPTGNEPVPPIAPPVSTPVEPVATEPTPVESVPAEPTPVAAPAYAPTAEPAYTQTAPPVNPAPNAPVYQQAPQPVYAQPYAPAPVDEGRGLSIASLVLGIAGIVTCCLYGIGIVPAIVGLILGIKGKKKTTVQGTKSMAIAGIVCSAIAIVLTVILIVLIIVVGVAALNIDPNSLSNYSKYR